MIRLQNPALGQVTFLLNFKEPQTNIRFAQGDAEVAFGSFGAGQSQQTNVPDAADPSMPRIIFAKDRNSIAISQISVQYTRGAVPRPHGTLDQQLQTVVEEIQNFYRQALEFRPAHQYVHEAVIVQINYPSSESMADLHKYVYDRFISFRPLGELASVQLQIGFKINDLYFNLGASVYQTRHFEWKSPAQAGINPSTVMLALNSGKLIEKGLQFTIDVNDRPRHEVGRSKDAATPDKLLETICRFTREQLPTIVSDK
ncbi:hypothetical protein [Burkholderia sp. BCC1999]|uniref:hypothetical protein n=1 Tax=Burkholderia sp. BCC1999 TaxID=2817448 RepID=UPI002AC3705C|nr:hypothetical protein [Burkholderia sp. BCC1999]